MESIYFVMCWACHRRCRHCYEDRFRPYVGDALEAVIAGAEANAPRIVASLPPTMRYHDRAEVDDVGDPVIRTGRIILAGGEALLDGVRERVTLPTLAALRARYRDSGGVRLAVQTTGDLVTPEIVGELIAHGMDHLSVSGLDDFHTGMVGDRKDHLRERLTALFEGLGMVPGGAADQGGGPPSFGFFGATPESWIGRIWPRGRAWTEGLSTATLADDFCARWSGGLGFLDHGRAGSEVAIDPNGDVFPCCMKTRTPLGNLLEEPLLDILDDLSGVPALEAINAGRPDRMGVTHGWGVGDYLAACETTTPGGAPYRNLCIGCDAFHREVLGAILDDRRRVRLARRQALPEGRRAHPAA